MGWLFGCGSARMDLLQLKRALAFLLALLCAPAHAAGYGSAAISGGAYKLPTGTYAVKGATATAANGAFITPATVSAAGKQVTMPASAAIAANAAQFAVSAIRLNPAGLMVGLTAQWLLGKGLTYVGDHFEQSVPGTNFNYLVLGSNPVGGSTGVEPQAAADLLCNEYGRGGTPAAMSNFNGTNQWNVICVPPYNGANLYYLQKRCIATNSAWTAACAAVPNTSRPAVESDWTPVSSGTLPDDVAQELARADVPIPVDNPVLAPSPVTENYGAPFVDPVTGKTVQTKTKITPDPSPTDPYRVRIESFNIEVSPAPAPQPGDPVILPKDEQPSDPCIDNPDRFGCMDGGTPEDVDLQTHTPNFTVTPVAIGGAGNCPPNPTFTAAHRTWTINYAPMCDAAMWLKPLVLAMAWLSAALIIAGAVRES